MLERVASLYGCQQQQCPIRSQDGIMDEGILENMNPELVEIKQAMGVQVLQVRVCFPVCVEVPSETEAVQGKLMKLRCISCMKREEVEATTVVEWFYRPEGGKDFLIYEYRNGHQEVESPFQGRLQWNGSKDLQDVSITVLNVTLNDSGLYTCNVSREFEFEAHRPFVKTTRLIPLRVTEEGTVDWCLLAHRQVPVGLYLLLFLALASRDVETQPMRKCGTTVLACLFVTRAILRPMENMLLPLTMVALSDPSLWGQHLYYLWLGAGEDFTSVVSEIMMYILLVFLTLWLFIEMIYCYRKVSKAEEAAQENASDYLAIPSENKENSVVPVEE
ncbi:Sodium channel subunit beta-3 [Microtus ochrogaster]|uniref:Sodium channel regulatory subunit beta-3 n=1 Tax=Microtus ochrogaster TaxID=79684 RepID=A0A8J6GJ98_MICOH|nr:Sodium channel subunit beta-3 [Microtus ochrogaster]